MFERLLHDRRWREYRTIRGNMLPVAKSKVKEFAIGTAFAVGHGLPRVVDVVPGAEIVAQLHLASLAPQEDVVVRASWRVVCHGQ